MVVHISLSSPYQRLLERGEPSAVTSEKHMHMEEWLREVHPVFDMPS